MSEERTPQKNHIPDDLKLQFGDEIEVEGSGFSFRPISGFELEIDGSVYMYSEDGNLEISMMGGRMEEDISIAELDDELAADFMENFDDYSLTEAGTEAILGITGFLSKIRFHNAEEEGLGRALICSPSGSQYFCILVIASADYWEAFGEKLFRTLKSHIRFHPQFTSEMEEVELDEHPDLTIETYEEISAEEDFILRIEKGDVSLLLAAHSRVADEVISITGITAPGGKQLYSYNPANNEFMSLVSDGPLMSMDGEVSFFFPRDNQLPLQPGTYQFTFATESGMPLQEVQVIIRTGRALDVQSLDLNFWLATENERFINLADIDRFKEDFHTTLNRKLSTMNLTVGEISCFNPAMDELAAFSTVNIDTDLADCSYIISETVEKKRALNIGLVDRFINGDPEAPCETSAISSGNPGMILSSASPHACILLNWSAFNGDLDQLADAVIDQLVVFSGINIKDTLQQEGQHLTPNREIAWRLRRHPIFYEAD
jgi:hypothetical protein